MGRHTIQLTDSEGSSFAIYISQNMSHLISPQGAAGSWRSFEEGYIRHNSGALWWSQAAGTATMKHLVLLSSGYWGLRLHEFYSAFYGTSDSGSGLVLQQWVLSFKPGRITWVLLE